MNSTLRTTLWLITDVFRQALASSSGWLMLGAIVVGGGLSLGLDPRTSGSPTSQGANSGSLHTLLGVWLPQTVGIVLAVFLTAGLLPTFLEPRNALVVLVKPGSRQRLVWARAAGTVLYVGGGSAIYFVATWIVLGIRTGEWPVRYFTAWFLFVVQFAACYSFSTMLATATRSAGACLIGATLFWILCFLVNLGRHAVAAFQPAQLTGASRRLIEICYWVLPRPCDGLLLAHDGLHPEPLSAQLELFRRLSDLGEPWPTGFFVTTVVFTLVTTAAAAYELETRDY